MDKRLLIFLSGIVWSIVGIMLCRLAYHWLTDVEGIPILWPVLAGTLLALVIHHFMFLKLLYRNMERILSREGKVCIFAFQAWKSYGIIIVMIAMGMLLRHSSIPRQYLAVIYIGFGGAMLLSSLVYYWHFFRKLMK